MVKKRNVSKSELMKAENQLIKSYEKIQHLGKQALISIMKIEAAATGNVSKTTMKKIHKVNRLLHGVR